MASVDGSGAWPSGGSSWWVGGSAVWRRRWACIGPAGRCGDLVDQPSFVDGQVVLLGDAAHAMTPNLGQGACQAIVRASRERGRLAQLGWWPATALRNRAMRRATPAESARRLAAVLDWNPPEIVR